jgi:hypothetical protein
MHIESIQTGVLKGKFGKASVAVFDDRGNPVPAAEVTGIFSDPFGETGTGLTDANDVAVIITVGEFKKPSYTFCVNAVSK